LVIADVVEDTFEALKIASESIASGKAKAILTRLAEFSHG